MSIIWKAWEFETMPDIIDAQILAICDILAFVNDKFLTEKDINDFRFKIFTILMTSDKRIQENDS